MLPALGSVNIQQAVCWMYPGFAQDVFLEVDIFAAAWLQLQGHVSPVDRLQLEGILAARAWVLAHVGDLPALSD